MKRTLLGIFIATSMFSPTVSSGQGNPTNCQNVSGQAQFILIPAPNDPFGRILGPATGTLRAAITAIVTNLTPTPTGAIEATSIETWVMGPLDQLLFDGRATFTPLPGQPIGTVDDKLTLTVKSGTGQYAGATGTIAVTGTGYNLFGPDAGPGKTYFQVNYSGSICRR
jgi:hypothetical protein